MIFSCWDCFMVDGRGMLQLNPVLITASSSLIRLPHIASWQVSSRMVHASWKSNKPAGMRQLMRLLGRSMAIGLGQQCLVGPRCFIKQNPRCFIKQNRLSLYL